MSRPVPSASQIEGFLGYLRSLPVPRMAYLAADLTVWLAIVLPGTAGEVIRGSLASSTFPLTIGPFLFLGAWCVVGLGLSYLTLQRRA